MRRLVLLTLALFAIDVQAEVINGKEHTCAELKAIVTERGRVDIQGGFGFATYASSPSQCTQSETAGTGIVFGTKDQNFCNVGYSCMVSGPGGGGGGGM